MEYTSKIRTRLHIQNKNWLAAICGDTGSGKSYSALALAHEIAGKDNTVYTVFDPLELFKLADSGKLKRGDVIVADEFGVTMSARQWQSVQNILIGYLLQTFRHLNVAFIWTVPNMGFVDVQARKLLHSYFQTVHINYKTKEATLSVFDVQVNPVYDKIYYKHPILENGNKLVHIKVPCISKEISEPYEERKKEFSEKLRHDAVQSLEKAYAEKKAEKEPKRKIDLKKIAAEVARDRGRFTTVNHGREYLDSDMIRNHFDIGIANAQAVRKYVERQKGHSA